jgi:release factor glutamine methyltransferase
MSLCPKKVFYDDCVFEVSENVYAPAEDSYLLAENLVVNEGDLVLDLGTGSGLIAILAAKKAKRVVAVDVNPFAVRYTRRNATLNNVGHKVEVREGDLFEPIEANETFDLILFNAPYLPSEEWEERDLVGKAWAGGKTGRNVIDRFISEAPEFLKQGGRILLVQSTLSNVEQSLRMFAGTGFAARVVAEKKVDFETIVVIEARRLDGDKSIR